MIDPADIARRMRSLPSLSAALSELERVLAKPRCSLDEVVQVITNDPALSANVLRIANAGLYFLPSPVQSVSHATVLVGLRRIRELATTAAFASVVPDRLAGYDMDAQDYWTHSIAVAILASELAPPGAATDVDRLFLAGLLHDIGKLALGSFLARANRTELEGLPGECFTLLHTEQALLGTDHACIGAELGELWRLPRHVYVAARWHHEPDRAQDAEDGGLVDRVHVADALAHLLGWGSDVAELARSPHPESLKRLGLGSRQLESVSSRAWDRVAEVRKLVNSGKGT